MHNEFTAILEKDGEYFIGYCPEIPGANGLGKSEEECKKNLAEAISLLLEDRRSDFFKNIPIEAIQSIVSISSNVKLY